MRERRHAARAARAAAHRRALRRAARRGAPRRAARGAAEALGGGLWLLRGGGTGAAAARDALLAQLPLLAGVRLRLALHAAADGPALLKAVAATPPRRERPAGRSTTSSTFRAPTTTLLFCHVGVARGSASRRAGRGFVDGGGASDADVDV